MFIPIEEVLAPGRKKRTETQTRENDRVLCVTTEESCLPSHTSHTRTESGTWLATGPREPSGERGSSPFVETPIVGPLLEDELWDDEAGPHSSWIINQYEETTRQYRSSQFRVDA